MKRYATLLKIYVYEKFRKFVTDDTAPNIYVSDNFRKFVRDATGIKFK